jgi:hypothetical protein
MARASTPALASASSPGEVGFSTLRTCKAAKSRARSPPPYPAFLTSSVRADPDSFEHNVSACATTWSML